MQDIVLNVEERKSVGGGKVKRLREKGYIPGVIYGKQIDSRVIKVKKSDLRDILLKGGKNVVFNVELEKGKMYPAIIKDMQIDTLKNSFLHIDLQQISLTEKLNSFVLVNITGQGKAESGGGVIVQQLEEVEVESLPQDIPEYIQADISDLTIGKSLTAGELNIPEGVTLATAPQEVIVLVTTIREEAEDTAEQTGDEVEEAQAEEKQTAEDAEKEE